MIEHPRRSAATTDVLDDRTGPEEGQRSTYETLAADLIQTVPMALLLRDVLDLKVFQRGRPEIVAGGDSLDRPVRWVHIADISDVGPLLKGSELLFTSGLGLSADEQDQRRYIVELDRAGVAGVVMTLGWRYAEAPPAIIEEADSTVVIHPGFGAGVDAYGNILIQE